MPSGRLDLRSALRAERMFMLFRLIGGSAAILITVLDASTHPADVYVVEQAIHVGIVVLGLYSWAGLRRLDGERPLRRFMRSTFAFDILLLASLRPLHAYAAGSGSPPPSLLLPLIGGLKYGKKGAWLGALSLVASQVLYEVLKVSVFDNPLTIDGSMTIVLIGTLAGLMSAAAAEQAAEDREHAERGEQEASRARRDVERMHAVILAGIGGTTDEAAERMADELGRQLGTDRVAIFTYDREEQRADLVTSTSIDLNITSALAPGGVIARAIEEEQVVHAAADEHLACGIPIRVAGRLAGIVLVELPPGSRTEAVIGIERVADQLALVLQAARAYETELRLATQFQELDRMRTEFIAITSHELRTPLTAISGFSETLDRLPGALGNAQARTLVSSIQKQSRRLGVLVDDLDTASRIDGGRLTIASAAVELAAVVARTIDAVGITASAHGPDATVWADEERLEQVLANLLRNAAEHGAAPFEVSWEKVDGRVEILVGDHGAGIPLKSRRHVFNRFFQAESHLGHSRGSGLGLSIAAELATLMRGSLELVDREPGAWFRLSLPATPHRPAAQADAQLGESSLTASASRRAD